jgi:hypothetical protein
MATPLGKYTTYKRPAYQHLPNSSIIINAVQYLIGRVALWFNWAPQNPLPLIEDAPLKSESGKGVSFSNKVKVVLIPTRKEYEEKVSSPYRRVEPTN